MANKDNKIPKIIHYCWFGGNPLPEDVKKYIESWKKFCPEYEIKEWNEKNFDVNKIAYVKEAYDLKKWAFITDYVRLYAMYTEGGIYMDTDVEVIKPLDRFLKHDAFSGFENNTQIPTGIMAARKHFPLFKELLDYYNNKHFVEKDGTLDLTTNVVTITNICLRHGFKQNGKYQEIDGLALYPKEYFCPKDFETGEIKITKNTYAIHHFTGSWMPKSDQKLHNARRKFYKIFGKNLGSIIYKIYNFCYRVINKIKKILKIK